MEIKPIKYGDDLWQQAIHYAKDCSWSAGGSLAKQMQENRFVDWERVFVVTDGFQICGYCTFTKTDCIPDVDYTPYLGYLFVGEEYRGQRLSEGFIIKVLEYAKTVGFDKVYLVSDHINLYEKYGFVKVDEKPAPWDLNKSETIFMHFT